MRTEIDLEVLPIIRRGGFDQAHLPGLHLAVPPRRTARSREPDLLVLFLALKGNAPISQQQQNQLLQGVSRTYYLYRGSVTASMRAAAATLNDYLLDRNLRSARSGLQTLAFLTMVVARGTQLYLGQAGPTHAFLVSASESQHLYDTHLAGRGLGTSRTTTVRFTQTDMAEGGLLIASPAPPPTWAAAALKGNHTQRLERLHQQLMSQAGPDLTAVLIQARPGQGQLHLLQPVPRQASMTRPASTLQPAFPAQAVTREPPAAEPAPVEPAEAPGPQEHYSPPPELGEAGHAEPADGNPQPMAAAPAVLGATRPAVATGTARPARPAGPLRAAPRPDLGQALKPVLLAVSRAVGNAWAAFALILREMIGRMTPGEGLFSLPSGVMAGVALTVPIIVVTVAAVVYFQRGLAAQHQIYLTQAAVAASQTLELQEPNTTRQGWEITLDLVEKAESYGRTDESQALRAQAQEALDQLNGVARLNFRTALTRSLSDEVRITRLVATEDDLYLLNGSEGTVLRAFLTGRGFELDTTFRCGPGAYGSFLVGPLVDMAPIPQGNEFNASVVAMDANGNLIYCTAGQAPVSAPLVPPDSNWGSPQAITLDSNSLYVLDPQTNAVWIYRGVEGNFRDRPRLFFSGQVPPMQDVIDLAVNRFDLYLLHADGHLTTCTFSTVAESPTRCEDPATYVDTRPGRQEGSLIEGGLFSQIKFTSPPDPSIYLLDPASQSIYHFSLRLTLQRQYRASTALPEGPATAFAVNPNRTVFIALQNQVFAAPLP